MLMLAFVQFCLCVLFLLSMTKHFPVQFILNSGHVEYELSVLMMGNIPNQTRFKSMTPVLQVEITPAQNV